MKNLNRFLIFVCLISFFSCSDFVNSVDSPSDQVDSDKLDDEKQVGFLIAGIQQRFATTYDYTILLADALSDALVFDWNSPTATSQSLNEIDSGTIPFDNPDIAAQFINIGELRFLADDLLRRAEKIDFTDEVLQEETLYTGNLYAGIARYLYATYNGLERQLGGGVINNGPFIPSSELYQFAISFFQIAKTHIEQGSYEERLLNSLIARTFLFNKDIAEAVLFARVGLQQGDRPFQALYSFESTNIYWLEGGTGRGELLVADRYLDYVEADPNEAVRVPLVPVTEDSIYWLQDKYDDADSPIDFMSWQENTLMIAELEMPNAPTIALNLVNQVRLSFGLDAISSLDIDVILAEREKTMFAQGLRLPDQRRFNRFHLPEIAWQYLPFSEEERINNSNF